MQSHSNLTTRSSKEIADWIIEWIARETDRPKDNFNATDDITAIGLSSIQALQMSGELADWIGIDIDPAAAWEYPTIETFSEYISEQIPR